MSMDNIVAFRAPYRHPVHATLAVLDTAIGSGAITDPVARNWCEQLAGTVRELTAELQRANVDAERWRSSAARLVATRAPIEAMEQTTTAARAQMARLAAAVAVADRESIDLDTAKQATALLAFNVDSLIVLTEALAMGYENLRARLEAVVR